jgi:flagellum-specific peptidoglycan hydrolase FlgJ
MNFDPQMMGILGLSLLKQADNPQANPMQLIGLLNQINNPSVNSNFTSNTQSPLPTTFSTSNSIAQTPSTHFSSMENTNDMGILNRLKAAAQTTYPDNPIMQQVALTQAIHESGALGKGSKLASDYNNYFGIKDPHGVNMKTQEYYNNSPINTSDTFAVNPNMETSFTQYRNLIGKPRYQSVLVAQDPNTAFVELQKAGYATDPKYANKLNAVYSRYVQPLYS